MSTTISNGALAPITVATVGHPSGGVAELPPAAAAGANAAVPVGTTATIVRAAYSSRIVCSIQPLGGDIYFGYDNTVTASTGIRISAGSVWEERDFTGVLYAIAATGSVDTRVAEL